MSAAIEMTSYHVREIFVSQRNLSLANRLVGELPAAERSLLLEKGEMVELALHEVLLSPGQCSEFVWFPVEGWVAQLLPMQRTSRSSTGRTAQLDVGVGVAMVGNEGMFDTSLLLDVARSHLRCQVHAPGRAFRVGVGPLRRLMREQPALLARLHRYLYVRQRQLAQQVLCMNYHTVEQRLVRCLLMARDRLHSKELFLTHEVLASVLGVRRESVTHTASTLQRRALISYSRGYLMLLDESSLLRRACGCYQADLDSYEECLVPGAGLSDAAPEITEHAGEGLGLLHGAQVRSVQATQLGADDVSRHLL